MLIYFIGALVYLILVGCINRTDNHKEMHIDLGIALMFSTGSWLSVVITAFLYVVPMAYLEELFNPKKK